MVYAVVPPQQLRFRACKSPQLAKKARLRDSPSCKENIPPQGGSRGLVNRSVPASIAALEVPKVKASARLVPPSAPLSAHCLCSVQVPPLRRDSATLTTASEAPGAASPPHKRRRESASPDSVGGCRLVRWDGTGCQTLCRECFDFDRRIGKSHLAEVWLAREKTTGLRVAIKQIRKKVIVDRSLEREFRSEVENQLHLRHRNLLRLYAYFFDTEFVYLVLEYCANGEVYAQLKVQGRFSEPFAAWCIRSVICGLQHLHSKHIIHRDLKPENLLLDHKGELKIADFGSSVHRPGLKCTAFCGTLDYLSPEVVGHRPYDEKVDLWAVGVLCFEFLSGTPPFQHDDFARTTASISRAAYSFPDGFPALAQDFVEKILVVKPSQRLTLEQMLEHPWLRMHSAEQ